MAKLFFRYATMRAGKSANLLMVAHNYKVQGKRVLLFTSGIDDRERVGTISSRTGLQAEAIPIFDELSIIEIVEKDIQDNGKLDCVLVDEAQFLEEHHISQLTSVVDDLDVPVIAYGLKTDFANNLFEGSENLLIQADKIEEIKTTCSRCNRKAIMNIRLDSNGKPTRTGGQVVIGDEQYQPVCRKHYNNYFEDTL